MVKDLGKLREFFKNNIAGVCVVAIFTAFTIYNIINHIPWYDEVNAYNIAQNLNVWEIFKLSRYEGHPMLWFLFLKPLTLLNVFFPYNLLIPNFLLILASLVILWKYSPFNNLEKTLITLSAPMFFYAYDARCYSLSILFLFAICSLYNKRHEHPYWYSILLVLLANTSVMALYGAFVLGLLFLHDMYTFRKQNILTRKNIVVMVTFFVVSGIFILAQLVNPHPAPLMYPSSFDFAKYFWNMTFFNPEIECCAARYIFMLILLLFPVFVRKNTLKPMLFLYGTTVLLVFSFTNIFPGSPWHTNFFYLYLVITFWLMGEKNMSGRVVQKVVIGLWGLFLFINVFTPQLSINGVHYPVVTELKENISSYQDNNGNTNIYIYPSESYIADMSPYLEKTGIKIFDMSAHLITEYTHFKNQSYLSTYDINPEIFKNEGSFIMVDEKANSRLKKELKRRHLLDKVKCVNRVSFTYIYQIKSNGEKNE